MTSRAWRILLGASVASSSRVISPAARADSWTASVNTAHVARVVARPIRLSPPPHERRGSVGVLEPRRGDKPRDPGRRPGAPHGAKVKPWSGRFIRGRYGHISHGMALRG